MRSNKHREDIKNPYEADKHFNNGNHVFHKHGKFKLTDQLNNIKNISKELLKQRLKNR